MCDGNIGDQVVAGDGVAAMRLIAMLETPSTRAQPAGFAALSPARALGRAARGLLCAVRELSRGGGVAGRRRSLQATLALERLAR